MIGGIPVKYRILPQNPLPSYLQLYQQLKQDIVNGFYPFGEKLPSKRLLAEETDVSVITVAHAYDILCDEGYLEARQRSGYYAIYRKDDFVTAVDLPTPQTSPRCTPQQKSEKEESFPFSVLSKTMRRVLSDYGERILIKSENHGLPELRSAIASYLGRCNGIHVRPEQIVIGAGAEYLYTLIVQLLGEDRRIFALESPSYEKIRQVYEANGIRCEMLKMTQNGILSAELAKSRAAILHVTPFHSYPSHITADVSKRNEYLRWAQQRNGYLIEDNYDSELTVSKKHEDTLFSMSEDGRVVYLNTFSKTIAPSFRVGYMVLPPHLLEQFEKRLHFYSCTVPVFEQYVLAELIQSGDFERHINRARRQRRKK